MYRLGKWFGYGEGVFVFISVGEVEDFNPYGDIATHPRDSVDYFIRRDDGILGQRNGQQPVCQLPEFFFSLFGQFVIIQHTAEVSAFRMAFSEKEFQHGIVLQVAFQMLHYVRVEAYVGLAVENEFGHGRQPVEDGSPAKHA